MQNFDEIMNVINTIKDNFGDEEFTNKDWETIRSIIHDNCDWANQVPTINTLRKNKLVKVNRVENFTIEKKNDYSGEYYACNDNGDRIMTWTDYSALRPFSAKQIEDIANGGKELHRTESHTETIEAKRYYYKFDPSGIEKICKALADKVEEYKTKMEELEASKRELTSEIAHAKEEVSKMFGIDCIGIGIVGE